MKKICQYCGSSVKSKPNRTLEQNRFLWARYTVLSDVTGHTPEELHEVGMTRCGFGRVVKIGPLEMFVRETSTTLDKKQFSELIKWQQVVADYLTPDHGEPIILPE